MLDLFISYYNFLTIALNYIIKRITFQPPKIPGYVVRKASNKIKKDIYFLSNNENYEQPKFKNATYEYIELHNGKKNKSKKIKSELLLIKPKNHLPICIIYSHGNCGDLGYSFYDCYLLAINTNCVVLSYEYPGYGSLGKLQLSERNTYKCIKNAYIYVNKVLKFKSENIFLYGFSLGTGVAFHLACKEKFPIGGLILQAPYLSILRVIYNFKKSKFFDIFKNCDKAKNLKAKTLFIQGNNDFVVPYIHGRILAKIIPKEYFYDFLTIKKGNHENLFLKNSEKIYNKIKKFIAFCNGIKIYNEKQKNLKLDNVKPIPVEVYTRDVDVESNIIYRSALLKNKIHIDTTTSDDTNSQFSFESSEKNEINREKNDLIISLNGEKNNNNTINKEESCDVLNQNIPEIQKKFQDQCHSEINKSVKYYNK